MPNDTAAPALLLIEGLDAFQRAPNAEELLVACDLLHAVIEQRISAGDREKAIRRQERNQKSVEAGRLATARVVANLRPFHQSLEATAMRRELREHHCLVVRVRGRVDDGAHPPVVDLALAPQRPELGWRARSRIAWIVWIGGDQHLGGREELGDLAPRLVADHLADPLRGRLARALHLDHSQGHAVHEQHDVGAAMHAILGQVAVGCVLFFAVRRAGSLDRELGDRVEAVVGRFVPVDEAQRPLEGFALDRHGHGRSEQEHVRRALGRDHGARYHVGALRLQLADRLLHSGVGDGVGSPALLNVVELVKLLGEHVLQDRTVEPSAPLPLGLGSRHDAPAEPRQGGEGGELGAPGLGKVELGALQVVAHSAASLTRSTAAGISASTLSGTRTSPVSKRCMRPRFCWRSRLV